jgi:P27 family predicted phage terminase small subunit
MPGGTIGNRGGGRHRKPTALHVLEGTARKDRINPNEPRPVEGRPRMPRNLTADEKRIWRSVVEQCESMGVLTVADGDAIADYVMWRAMGDDVKRQLDEQVAKARIEGKTAYVISSGNGTPLQNPLVVTLKQVNAAKNIFRRAFGFDPESRSRIQTNPKKAISEFEAYRNQRKLKSASEMRFNSDKSPFE